MKTKIFKAFTLIELLIVIVIIGILATALIPRVTGVQDKARYARVEKDIRDLKTAILMAQANTNKSLKDITGTVCSECLCRNEGSTGWDNKNLKTMASNGNCRYQLKLSLEKIAVAAGMSSGSLASLETDPWGSPYLLNENENELGACSPDTIRTAGKNGIFESTNTHFVSYLTGDDQGFEIPPMGCPGAY